MLWHKILGNYNNPTQDELADARASIKEKGLIAKVPDEWKSLLPKHLQSIPVVWLIGHYRVISIREEILDKSKLFHIDCDEVDWWVYADDIPPEAVEIS